jgi:geranylgeranyl diphosphate synthase, type II
MQPFDVLQAQVEQAVKRLVFPREPRALYDPIRYTMEPGGKRIRPVLVLMACELFDGDIQEAMHAAMAAEVFHNFTLIHDDIMDKAPIRRGQPSVVHKWNADVAILAGDTMFASACGYLHHLDVAHIKPVLNIFSRTAVEVCEGQQYDMNFESREDVSIDEYMEMIRLKTASLIAACLEMGAVIADASDKDVENICEFGRSLGLAFQLQDDLLDVYGDEKAFGKKTGNDIVTNKKTFLYIKAFEIAAGEAQSALRKAFGNTVQEPGAKIAAVKKMYDELHLREHAEQAIGEYFSTSLSHLDAIQTPAENKRMLRNLAETLMQREY